MKGMKIESSSISASVNWEVDQNSVTSQSRRPGTPESITSSYSDGEHDSGWLKGKQCNAREKTVEAVRPAKKKPRTSIDDDKSDAFLHTFKTLWQHGLDKEERFQKSLHVQQNARCKWSKQICNLQVSRTSFRRYFKNDCYSLICLFAWTLLIFVPPS